MDATPLGADAGPASESENPLAAAPPADIELAAADEAGAFPLTLKDMFGKTQTVQVSAEAKVFEVKELLRAAKESEAGAALASAREALAQLEGEAAQAPEDKARAAAPRPAGSRSRSPARRPPLAAWRPSGGGGAGN